MADTRFAIWLFFALAVTLPGRAPLRFSKDDGQSTQAESIELTRKAYTEKIKKTYTFPYGRDIVSAPGNALAQDGGFIDPGALPDARYCGHCHQEAFREWRQSLHANAFRTPFYQHSVSILVKAKGIEYARYCDSCHDPIAVLSGAEDAKSKVSRSFDGDGLTCMTCHSIQSVEPKLGSGSFVLGIPSVLVDDKGNPIPGTVPDSEILAHLDRHSQAVMRDLYRKPEFCSACHKASLPKELNDYRWLPSFSAYDEWQNSQFSDESPLVFYPSRRMTCQNCHMKRVATHLPDSGSNHGTLASHRWLAGNTAVPFNYGYDEQLDKTIRFLKGGDYLGIDLFGLKRAGDSGIPTPLRSGHMTLEPGEMVEAWVVIQNTGIGHSMIPELRDLYEAWVQFTVNGADGATLFESGFLQPDGNLDPQAHSFVNRPIDGKGNFVDDHMVWDLRSIGYDNTVRAGHSTLVRYQFRVPERPKGPLTVTTAVKYRHFRESYLNHVLGEHHPDYPIVELASRSQSFQIGLNPAPERPAGDNSMWMSWNNLGIALLDQERYDDAAFSFEQVIRLRPAYKDGYVNVALVEIAKELYAETRLMLEKALTLRPNDGRALFYLALVERHDGHFDAEIADLEKVVAQYPNCRDARRELGVAYDREHRVNEALRQFEALQAIDPDDLAAHFHLAGLYLRMGLRTKAEREMSAFESEKPDPAAPTYSPDYLRDHPEMPNEFVPWHVHKKRETSP